MRRKPNPTRLIRLLIASWARARHRLMQGRTLARNAGVSRRFFARHLARVSYTNMAEFQARGLIHVHAVMRLDGPTGPESPPRGRRRRAGAGRRDRRRRPGRAPRGPPRRPPPPRVGVG
jgi:hypothetical protein